MNIGGLTVEAGARRSIRIPINTGLHGETLALWVHALRGVEKGPVVALLAVSHGTEWFAIDPIRRLVESLDTNAMAGTILVVPVVNPPALALQVRDVPDGSVPSDINRAYGSRDNWTSSQIASVVTDEVLSQATHLIEYRPGPWGCAFEEIGVGSPDNAKGKTEDNVSLAQASGLRFVRRLCSDSALGGSSSAMGYAVRELGIGAFSISVGGPGFGPKWTKTWIEQTLSATRGVLNTLGVIVNERENCLERQLVHTCSRDVTSRNGGFLRPRFGPQELGSFVEEGALLAEVASPYTFEIIEEVRAPVSGYLSGVARAYAVHPGDCAFRIAVVDDDASWTVSPGSENKS